MSKFRRGDVEIEIFLWADERVGVGSQFLEFQQAPEVRRAGAGTALEEEQNKEGVLVGFEGK